MTSDKEQANAQERPSSCWVTITARTCVNTTAAVMAAGASSCALIGKARATVTLRGMHARAKSASTKWGRQEVGSLC